MKEINIAEGIGMELLKHLHNYNEDVFLDDTEYIPLIKIIIEAINDHISLYDISKPENETLKNKLLNHARDLYVEVCQINAKENGEDISDKQVKDESLELFNYIYEHGEYPD